MIPETDSSYSIVYTHRLIVLALTFNALILGEYYRQRKVFLAGGLIINID